jgi:hypothetical protein
MESLSPLRQQKWQGKRTVRHHLGKTPVRAQKSTCGKQCSSICPLLPLLQILLSPSLGGGDEKRRGDGTPRLGFEENADGSSLIPWIEEEIPSAASLLLFYFVYGQERIDKKKAPKGPSVGGSPSG